MASVRQAMFRFISNPSFYCLVHVKRALPPDLSLNACGKLIVFLISEAEIIQFVIQRINIGTIKTNFRAGGQHTGIDFKRMVKRGFIAGLFNFAPVLILFCWLKYASSTPVWLYLSQIYAGRTTAR
jgi:hypothetical protein